MTHADTPHVITREVRYHSDGGKLLADLCNQGLLPRATSGHPTNVVLLDSADIASKQHLTTIALLETSASIQCDGDQVRLTSTHPIDGPAAIERVCEALPQALLERTETEALFNLPSLREDEADEETRLKQRATMEPLRILTDTPIDHPHLPLVAGAVAFDYLATYESLPEVAHGFNSCPDYLFYLARIILVVDHPSQSAQLVGASLDLLSLEQRMNALAEAIDAAPESAPESTASEIGEEGAEPLIARPTISDSDFAELVTVMQEHIAAGDIYQVVPSRGFIAECADALTSYRFLRDENPSPYMFYIGTENFELFGASPESSLLHSAKTHTVAIRPIAGTRPRGFAPDGSIDHELDIRLELELRSDAKEVAEHVMLVDLARNDVARVSKRGTRRVEQLLRVDRYSRVMHLVSEVSGTLAEDLHPLDAFRASMTMGTLTGAPKLRAAELIRTYEGLRRGSYGGAVGYLRGDGELDTCIVIRSAFVKDGRAIVQAGAGVVADSVPAREAEETVHKASAVLRALAASARRPLVIAASAEEGEF